MLSISAAGSRSGMVAQATTVSGMVNGGSSARAITIVLVSPPSPITGQKSTPDRSATATMRSRAFRPPASSTLLKRYPAAPKLVEQMVMERRVGLPRERDQRFVCEVRWPEHLSRGEAVVAWEVHGQVLAREEGGHLQIVVLLGVEEDGQIEVAPPEPFNLFERGQVSDVSLERRLRSRA